MMVAFVDLSLCGANGFFSTIMAYWCFSNSIQTAKVG